MSTIDLTHFAASLEIDRTAHMTRMAEQATIACGAHADLIANLLADDPSLTGTTARLLRLSDPETRLARLEDLLRWRDDREVREELAVLDSEYVFAVDYHPDGGFYSFGSSDVDPDTAEDALIILGYEPVARMPIRNGFIWAYERQRPLPQFFTGSLYDSAMELWERAEEWTRTEDCDSYWSACLDVLERDESLVHLPFEDRQEAA